LAPYILLGLFLRPLIGVILRGSRDSLLAAGLMHSVSNRTNNDNGITRPCSTESFTEWESSSQQSYSSPHLHSSRGADGSARPTGWNLIPTLARRRRAIADPLLNTAVGVGDDIVDVRTDQQEIRHAT